FLPQLVVPPVIAHDSRFVRRSAGQMDGMAGTCGQWHMVVVGIREVSAQLHEVLETANLAVALSWEEEVFKSGEVIRAELVDRDEDYKTGFGLLCRERRSAEEQKYNKK